MADKTIQDLPRLDRIGVEDLVPVADASNNFNPHAASGAVFRALVREQAGAAVAEIERLVDDAAQSATSAQQSATASEQSAQQSATASEQSASSAQESAGSATAARQSATEAASSLTASKSWAVGGTGTRPGEDTDNAKYWAEQAYNASGGGVTSFNGRIGAVVPQDGDYTASMVGAVGKVSNATAGNIPTLTSDGRLEDSGKELDDFADAPLKQNLTIYVNASTGSNSNDGLSADTAKLTINGALAAVPKDLGTRAATIKISGGMYDEVVSISGFSGGLNTGFGGNAPGILIDGEAVENTQIKAIVVSANVNIYIKNATIGTDPATYSGPSYTAYRGGHYFHNCKILYKAKNQSCIQANGQNSLYIYNTQIDSGNVGVDVVNGGIAFIRDSQITAEASGIRVVAGLCAISSTTTIDAPAEFQKSSGGIAFKEGLLA